MQHNHHAHYHDQHHHRSLGRKFGIIARNIQIIVRETLRDSSIGSGQFMFLHRIFLNDGISQQELSRILDVDKATCARAVFKLARAGYVRRKPDGEDHRLHHLHLTDEGIEIMPRIKRTMQMVTDICASGLSGEEQDELLRLLDMVVHSTATAIDTIRRTT